MVETYWEKLPRMKAKTNALTYDEKGLHIDIHPKYAEYIYKLQQQIKNGKVLDVEIKVHREKRSLNANAYLWILLNEIAIVLNSTSWEVYIEMLRSYGVCRPIPVFPEDAKRERQRYRIVEELGAKYVDGYKFLVWQVWEGSHTYNTKEFSRLLDGTIEEAKALGIDVISKADRDLLLSSWEEDKQGAKI